MKTNIGKFFEDFLEHAELTGAEQVPFVVISEANNHFYWGAANCNQTTALGILERAKLDFINDYNKQLEQKT